MSVEDVKLAAVKARTYLKQAIDKVKALAKDDFKQVRQWLGKDEDTLIITTDFLSKIKKQAWEAISSGYSCGHGLLCTSFYLCFGLFMYCLLELFVFHCFPFCCFFPFFFVFALSFLIVFPFLFLLLFFSFLLYFFSIFGFYCHILLLFRLFAKLSPSSSLSWAELVIISAFPATRPTTRPPGKV